MIKINNKFNIGDKAYVIAEDYTEIVCDVCKNEHYIEMIIGDKSYNITCPECNGITQVKESIKVYKITIDGMFYELEGELESGEEAIFYHYESDELTDDYCWQTSFFEQRLFHTRTVAEDKCSELKECSEDGIQDYLNS